MRGLLRCLQDDAPSGPVCVVHWRDAERDRELEAAWRRGYEAGRHDWRRSEHPSPTLVRALLQMVPRELLDIFDAEPVDAEPVKAEPPQVPPNVRLLLEAAGPLLAPPEPLSPVE